MFIQEALSTVLTARKCFHLFSRAMEICKLKIRYRKIFISVIFQDDEIMGFYVYFIIPWMETNTITRYIIKAYIQFASFPKMLTNIEKKKYEEA